MYLKGGFCLAKCCGVLVTLDSIASLGKLNVSSNLSGRLASAIRNDFEQCWLFERKCCFLIKDFI